jgi:pilus assembly protein CpaF
MVGMTGIEIPLKALRSQVSSALNVIVQAQRLSDGRRRVVSVQEIVGMESDTVTMQEIFRFDRTGTDAEGNVLGRHRASGIRPKFVRRAEEYGFHVPAEMFKAD